MEIVVTFYNIKDSNAGHTILALQQLRASPDEDGSTHAMANKLMWFQFPQRSLVVVVRTRSVGATRGSGKTV